MKKLSRDQEIQKAEHVHALNKAAEELSGALAEVNALIEGKLAQAIDAYNAAVSAAQEFRDDVVGEMQNYADERSDKWRDGDAGQAYESWKGEWESLDMTELYSIETIDEPDMAHADGLEQLQHEPDR